MNAPPEVSSNSKQISEYSLELPLVMSIVWVPSSIQKYSIPRDPSASVPVKRVVPLVVIVYVTSPQPSPPASVMMSL